MDLSTMAHKPAAYLVTAILDPNQAVESRYTAYAATTTRDEEYTGVIQQESAQSITLRLAGGIEVTLLRGDIRSLTSSGRSLMPEGFETVLPPAAMADLLAFLRNSP